MLVRYQLAVSYSPSSMFLNVALNKHAEQVVKHSAFVCIMMEAYVIGGLGVKCSVDSRPLFSVLFFVF